MTGSREKGFYKAGRHTKHFQTIHSMFKDTKCMIKLPREITEAFPSTYGVEQGVVLSPLLFHIFNSDLVKSLDISGGDIIVCNGV